MNASRSVRYFVLAAPLILFFPPLFGNGASWGYSRDAVLGGEWWRLLSAHFAHLSISHAALNATGLIVGWVLLTAIRQAAVLFPTLLWCSLGTGLGLLVFSPEVEWYVGLSGTLHGLFLVGGALEFRRTRDRAFAWLVAIVLVKTVAEQRLGVSIGSFELIGGDIIEAAHLYGALSGVLLLPFLYLVQHQTRRGGANESYNSCRH